MEIRERNAIRDIKTKDKLSIKKKWQPSVLQMVAKRMEEVSQEDKEETAVYQVEQAAAAAMDETINIITPRHRKGKRREHCSDGMNYSEIKTRQSAVKFAVGRASNRGTSVPTRPKRKIQQTTQNMKNAARSLLALAQKFADAVAKASSAMSGAIAGVAGGVVLLIVLCAVVIVAAVAASPYGIFFADEPQPGAIPLSEAIAQINAEFEAKLIELQVGDYDSVVIEGGPPDWREVVAVFVVKVTAGESAQVVASLSTEQVEELRTVFWDMTEIKNEVLYVERDEDAVTILQVSVVAKTLDEIQEYYSFTEGQVALTNEMLNLR